VVSSSSLQLKTPTCPDKRIEDYTEADARQCWAYCRDVLPTKSAAVQTLVGPICAGIAARFPSVTGVAMTEEQQRRAGTTREQRAATTYATYPWLDPAFSSGLNGYMQQMVNLRAAGKDLISGGKDCRFNTGMIEYDVPCSTASLSQYIWRRDLYAAAQGFLRALATAPPREQVEQRITWTHLVTKAIWLAEQATGVKSGWLYPSRAEAIQVLRLAGPARFRLLTGSAPLDVQRYLVGFDGVSGGAIRSQLPLRERAGDYFMQPWVCVHGGSTEEEGLLNFSSVPACRQDVPGRALFEYLMARPDAAVVNGYELVGPGMPLEHLRRLHGDVSGGATYRGFVTGPILIEILRRWARFLGDTPFEVIEVNMAAPRYLNALIAWAERVAADYGKTFQEVLGLQRSDLEALATEFRNANAASIAAAGSDTLAAIPVIGAILGLIGTVLYGWFFDLVGYTECPPEPPIMMSRTLRDMECNFDPNVFGGAGGAYNRVVDAGARVGLAFPDAFRAVPSGTGDDAVSGAGATKAVLAFGAAALVGAGVAYFLA
jgi:hypothetical protein